MIEYVYLGLIHQCIDCVDWFIAGLLYLTFICRINYINFPHGSENREPESAYCAMIDENISPKVGACYHIIQ